MDTSTGATTVMAKTRAEDYYRRSGFSRISIRDRPGIRREKDIVSVREYHLDIGTIAELTIYPELTMREKPWIFWGKVIEFTDSAVILQQIGGKEAGTSVTVPYRYFQDGRVYRWAGIDEK